MMIDDGMMIGGDMMYDGEMMYGDDMGTETSTGITMDGLLANWFFVGGVTGGVLVLSIVIGLLLAKLRIKKGFDVYED